MKFSLGLLCGFILGAVVAMTYSSQAQLAPVESTLGDSLQWQRADQALQLQRELERRTAESSKPPCPY